MIGTIGTAAKFRTAGSRSDARGAARGMRRTAADSIMASQFYKNGSHDSWESTKCQRYHRSERFQHVARHSARSVSQSPESTLCSLAGVYG